MRKRKRVQTHTAPKRAAVVERRSYPSYRSYPVSSYATAIRDTVLLTSRRDRIDRSTAPAGAGRRV